MNGHRDCQEIERVVWTEGPEAVASEHVETCVSCREEVRQAADLYAALSGLQTRLAEAPAFLEEAIFAALQRSRLERARDVVAHPRFWRGAAVGAAAAATAAVGVLVARRRIAAARSGIAA